MRLVNVYNHICAINFNSGITAIYAKVQSDIRIAMNIVTITSPQASSRRPQTTPAITEASA